MGKFKTSEGRIAAAAVAGGAGSVLGGGKFANGAVTGAFSRLFADEIQNRRETRLLGDKRLVPGIKVYRKDIDLDGEDKYGHWWIEIDGVESYGWWPKEPVGVKGTLFGVEGELNGQTSFYGGTPTTDPHQGRYNGADVFDVYGSSSVSKQMYVDQIRAFATDYSGSWSWPIGQNCHSFQEQMLNQTGLSIRPAGG